MAVTDTNPGGSIVAFEGNHDTVATQLRLLPSAPHIMILPNIQSYLPADDGLGQGFEAHTYIRKAHDAVNARNETARAFLENPSSPGKRLVFTNGGAPSAQAICIRAIMKYETDGDHIKAESIFTRLVKDGLNGLEKQAKALKVEQDDTSSTVTAKDTSAETVSASEADVNEPDREEEEDHEAEESQDPITRAMRAADALDRQTASLQPSNDIDLTITTRSRSSSLPVYGYSDNFGDAAPFFVFGAKQQQAEYEAEYQEPAEEIYVPKPTRFSVTHYDPLPTDEPIFPGFSDIMPPPQSPRCIGESYTMAPLQSPRIPDAFTPWTDIFSPKSPDNVVFGEASVLDIRASGRKPSVIRTRSLDRLFSAAREADASPRSDSPDIQPLEPPRPRPQSCMVVGRGMESTSKRPTMIDGPRTIMVKAKRSPILVSPVPDEKKRRPARMSYVDKGTDAEDFEECEKSVQTEDPSIIEELQLPYEPALPLVEDFVVYFKDEIPDVLLDSVIESYRNGRYPIMSYSTPPSETEEGTDEMPGTPDTQSLHQAEPLEAASEDPQVAEPSADEYDPYAYIQSSCSTPASKAKQIIPKVKVEKPPTPQETPEPSVSDNEEKFHNFKVFPDQTAVAVQNALRSVLNVHFPPEPQGPNQFHFSLLPELEGLWQPIFREAEPGSPRKDNRKTDQILAVGAQRGIKREFSSAIVGQLEKLGTKTSGLSRSGRLDFRYLLANAMQAFTAQPLKSQTSDNPFTNPYLLATLIIPHLETYLALHAEVRYLLLEYPPEHLPTILALQKLVGLDLMKVAQIVDAKSKEMLPFTHIRGGSIGNKSDTSSVSTGNLFKTPVSASPKLPSPEYAMSKANFLLTSTATDEEIATFISTVWKILSEVSKFYKPELPIKKLKERPPSLQSKFSPFPRGGASAMQSPGLMSPIHSGAIGPPPPQLPASPGPSSRAPSLSSETVKTRKSGKSKHSRAMSRTSRLRPPTGDGASFMTFDPAEDSDYDNEARRLMPFAMQKPKRRKGDSRKALKFLGLA